MENKYYLSDIESGYKYEVSKERYEAFMKCWEISVPKLNQKIGVPILCGTSGEWDNTNIKDMFYDYDGK